MERKCYCCGKAEHMSLQCRFKNKLITKWAINISQQSYAQASNMEPRISESVPASNYKQTTQTQSESWADCIINYINKRT
jgi:hypothetical protein